MPEIDLDLLLRGVQKPARYSGGEWNAVPDQHGPEALNVALCCLDGYESGMGSRELQGLYVGPQRGPGNPRRARLPSRPRHGRSARLRRGGALRGREQAPRARFRRRRAAGPVSRPPAECRRAAAALPDRAFRGGAGRRGTAHRGRGREHCELGAYRGVRRRRAARRPRRVALCGARSRVRRRRPRRAVGSHRPRPRRLHAVVLHDRGRGRGRDGAPTSGPASCRSFAASTPTIRRSPRGRSSRTSRSTAMAASLTSRAAPPPRRRPRRRWR